jgi:hypothetical protein
LYQFYRAGLWYFLVVLGKQLFDIYYPRFPPGSPTIPGLNIANILVDVLNVRSHEQFVPRLLTKKPIDV